jgi:hypothetical protein
MLGFLLYYLDKATAWLDFSWLVTREKKPPAYYYTTDDLLLRPPQYEVAADAVNEAEPF